MYIWFSISTWPLLTICFRILKQMGETMDPTSSYSIFCDQNQHQSFLHLMHYEPFYWTRPGSPAFCSLEQSVSLKSSKVFILGVTVVLDMLWCWCQSPFNPHRVPFPLLSMHQLWRQNVFLMPTFPITERCHKEIFSGINLVTKLWLIDV